jgi:hypothetical protein
VVFPAIYTGGAAATNVVLSHPVEVVEGSLDFVSSYFPATAPSATKAGFAGWILSESLNNFSTINETINYIFKK